MSQLPAKQVQRGLARFSTPLPYRVRSRVFSNVRRKNLALKLRTNTLRILALVLPRLILPAFFDRDPRQLLVV